MDALVNYIAGAVTGLVIALAIGWVERRWRGEDVRAAEKRARLEVRFEQVRAYLVMGCEICQTVEDRLGWGTRVWGEAGERWRKKLVRRFEVISANPVVTAPWLFVQDEEVLEQLQEAGNLVEFVVNQAGKTLTGEKVDGKVLPEAARRVEELAATIQSRLDQLVDER